MASDFARAVQEVLENFEIDSTTGCWIYKGGIDPSVGYGRVMIDGKRYHTHRLAAFLYCGLDLDDPKQFACHTRDCSSRLCINSKHIYVGDNQSNQLDVSSDKCKKGHDLIGDNIYVSYRKSGTIMRNCKICSKERYQAKKNLTNIDRKVG